MLERQQMTPEEKRRRASEKTILIVEDNELNIIAVTAFAMKGDEEKIREGGCEAYIAKPISVVQFLETVDRFLQ
jgi:two-component system, cell cycle response regulator DivK